MQKLLASLNDAVRLGVESGKRQLFLLTTTQWHDNEAAILASLEAGVVLISQQVNNSAADNCCLYSNIPSLLGRSFDHVIFDTSIQGFSASAFGIASGLLNKCGVFIVVLTAEDTLSAVTIEAKRFAVHADESNYDSLFDRRIAELLSLHNNDDGRASIKGDYVSDQQGVVAAIVSQLRGRAHRPLVLTADRGRGKSHCLGVALNSYLATKPQARVVLCAASKSSLVEVYKVLGRDLSANIQFLPVDQLIDSVAAENVDILLIDEAAAIPIPQLMVLVSKFKRVVLASTVHGYEGSGRGFGIRFFQQLSKTFKQWRHLQLTIPVRWLENDPLESLTNQLLLLDAEPAAVTSKDDVDVQKLKFVTLSADELVEDENLLRQFFGLLVSAHYQTTPDDLRMLLDSTAIQRYALMLDGVPVAAAIVVQEGRLAPSLVESIAMGERRPPGHVVAQQLVTTYGEHQAGLLSGHRVMRIAVHYDLQGHGIGGYLLAQIELSCIAAGGDYLSSTFGADARLLRFWQTAGYQPVKFGFSRDAASGEHAAIVIKPLSSAGIGLANSCRQQFLRSLPSWLVEQLRSLTENLTALAFMEGGTLEIEAELIGRLSPYLGGRSNYDYFVQDLKLLVVGLFGHGVPFTEGEVTLLVSKILKQNSWSHTATQCGFSGRKQTEAALKETLNKGLSTIGMLG